MRHKALDDDTLASMVETADLERDLSVLQEDAERRSGKNALRDLERRREMEELRERLSDFEDYWPEDT